MLDKEMIKDPRGWQLVIEAGVDTLSVMMFSHREHQSLIYREIPLARDTSPLRAFQDAVYDNPLLLGDFGRTTLLIPSRRVVVTPDILDDDSRRETYLSAFPPATADTPEEMITETLPDLHTVITMGVDREFVGFARRTFNNPALRHPLTPTALYFKSKHPGAARGKMIANLRPDRCDIVMLGEHAPQVINSYPTRDPMDALYYIMACRQVYGLLPSDELILAGDTATRAAVTPQLRRFIRYVIPAILPASMFRAGRDALRAPFEVTVTPLTGQQLTQ